MWTEYLKDGINLDAKYLIPMKAADLGNLPQAYIEPQEIDIPEKNAIIRHFAANDRFFLHVMMAGVESLTVSCKGIGLSNVMVGMGGNGVEFGIQLAGTGNRWYKTAAPKIKGTMLKPTYTEDDLVGYLGDSCVTEVYGLGGMSAIAGPAYMRLTGSNYAEARSRTEKTERVSLGKHTFVCDKLGALGVKLDPEKNEKCDGKSIISADDSAVCVRVIPTDEELCIARRAYEYKG